MRLGLFAVVLAVLCAGVVSVCHAADFEAIPEAQKSLYTFDLKRNFYEDEAAFEADLNSLVQDIDKLEALKGKVSQSAENLYQAYYLSEKVLPVWYKLWVYSDLRYAINTDDFSHLDRIQKTSGDLDSRIQFVRNETQSIDDGTLEKYVRAKPRLKDYAFAIEEARRYRPHTLSLDKEELLSTLSPYIGVWPERLYQMCVDRTNFPDIAVGGDTLDVNINYSALINVNDRDTRKKTWLGYYSSLAEHRDIYAFTLIRGIETRNKLAALRGFRNYPDARFFDLYLSYDDVSGFFDQIAKHAYIRKEYERVRRARIQATTGYDTVYIWDRTVQPADFVKPRFAIGDACRIVETAMAPLGDEYKRDLEYLFDPANRRLDIVGGPKRMPGMFASGYPGAPYQFFSMSYNGYLPEVEGLAHESGHSVHHKVQADAGVRALYLDGPRYITESIAVTSELLVGYHMYANEKDLEKKTYYLEQFLESVLSLLTNNMFANLELKLYEGVAEGTLKEADDLDSLAFSMVIPYSIYYEHYPQYKAVWTAIHHYYDVPMYNVNYVFAQAIASIMLDKIINEPGFVDKYVALVRSGFDRPAPEMLEETTGIDIHDPSVLASGFAFLEQKTQELRQMYDQLGIRTD